jgi:hypothetical protein
MDVIEKRANIVLNVRAGKEVSSRQKTGSAFSGLWGDAFRQRQIAVLVRHGNSSMSI